MTSGRTSDRCIVWRDAEWVETDLDQAKRHVAIGEALVAEQKEIIERLRVKGDLTGGAERLLRTLEESLTLMRKHLAHEQSAT